MEALVVMLIIGVALVVILRRGIGGLQKHMGGSTLPPPIATGASVAGLRRTLQRGELPAPIDVSSGSLPARSAAG